MQELFSYLKKRGNVRILILHGAHKLTKMESIKIYSIFLKIADSKGRALVAFRRKRNLYSFKSIWR